MYLHCQGISHGTESCLSGAESGREINGVVMHLGVCELSDESVPPCKMICVSLTLGYPWTVHHCPSGTGRSQEPSWSLGVC